MTPVQETVGDRSVINVTMSPAASQLDEVVVIGYGTAARRDLTGSITKIDGSVVADKPSTNPVASLQGKVAGVQITNSGRPGAEPDIRIRGRSEEHTSELQSLMRISYAVFCLKKKNKIAIYKNNQRPTQQISQ